MKSIVRGLPIHPEFYDRLTVIFCHTQNHVPIHLSGNVLLTGAAPQAHQGQVRG